GGPAAEGGPVRRRQPLVRPRDDAARRPREPVRPAAGADLPGRRRQDLRGVRQAVLAVRAVRQRQRDGSRRHARPEAGATADRGDSVISPAEGARRAIQTEAFGNPVEVARLIDVTISLLGISYP